MINLYLNKNLRWFYCLIFYTIPGVLYFNSVPKPDPFVIFFISIALYYLNEKKYNKSIIFFGIATGVKIVGIFALLLAIIYLLYTKKITMQNLFHDGGFSFMGISEDVMNNYMNSIKEE